MPGGWGGAQYRGPPKAKGGGGEGGEGWGPLCDTRGHVTQCDLRDPLV